MISFSEIDTTVKRATRAIGFSWGIAEEIGKNIRLLEMYGLPGVRNLNKYLKVYKNDKFEEIKEISTSNSSNGFYCPIVAGLNFFDQSIVLNKYNEINISNLAYPLLFLPFVSRASEMIGKRIFVKMDSKEFLFNFNQSIYSNYLSSEIIEKTENINLKFIENKNTFSKKEWSELYILSEKTFVDESEELKIKGAGAGLTDND